MLSPTNWLLNNCCNKRCLQFFPDSFLELNSRCKDLQSILLIQFASHHTTPFNQKININILNLGFPHCLLMITCLSQNVILSHVLKTIKQNFVQTLTETRNKVSIAVGVDCILKKMRNSIQNAICQAAGVGWNRGRVTIVYQIIDFLHIELFTLKKIPRMIFLEAST